MKLFLHQTPNDAPASKPHSPLMASLESNPMRNGYIAEQALNDVGQGHTVLIAFSSDDYIDNLQRNLNSVLTKPVANKLTANQTGKERVASIQSIKDGDTKIILTTVPMLGHGFNVPFTAYYKVVPEPEQFICKKNLPPLIRLFVDAGNQYLRAQAETRILDFQKLGYVIEE